MTLTRAEPGLAGPDIDDRQVVGGVGADKPSVEAPPIGQRDNQLARAADYVRVRHDIPFVSKMTPLPRPLSVWI